MAEGVAGAFECAPKIWTRNGCAVLLRNAIFTSRKRSSEPDGKRPNQISANPNSLPCPTQAHTWPQFRRVAVSWRQTVPARPGSRNLTGAVWREGIDPRADYSHAVDDS